MAIKGKTKSKTKKAVTRGPKPTYVPVRKPFLARRGIQVGVLAMLFAVLAAGLWYGFAKQATRDREKARAARAAALQAREASIVGQFVSQMDTALGPDVGSKLPPGDRFGAFPGLKTSIEDMVAGKGKQADAVSSAKAVVSTAPIAYKAIEAIGVAKLLGGKGFPAGLIVSALDAQTKIGTALHLYEDAANLLLMAVAASGDQRTGLLASASSVLGTATSILDSGYTDYVNAQATAGVFNPTQSGGSGSRAGSSRVPVPDDRRTPARPRVPARRSDVGTRRYRAFDGGLPVAAPHLPGFGGSPAAGEVMTMAAAAERCLQALEHAGLRPRGRLRLVDGRLRALELWRTAPERFAGLVLANTRAGSRHPGGRRRPPRAGRSAAREEATSSSRSRRRCCRRRRARAPRDRRELISRPAGAVDRGGCARDGRTPGFHARSGRRSTCRR